MALQESQSPGSLRVTMHRCRAVREDVMGIRAATALAEAGLAVSIVDVDQDDTRPRREWLRGVSIRHVVIPHLANPTRFKPWLLVKLARSLIARTVALLCSNADVYHALEWDATLACYLAGRLRQKPVIYELYDLPLDNPYYGQYLRRRIYRALRLQLLRRMVPSFAAIVATSPQHARVFQRRYGGKTPVIARNIPEFQRPTTSDSLRRRLELPPNTRIALYQGYFQSNRALDGLVRAARFLGPDIVIVLMGKGSYQAQLQDLILREGVSDRVRLVPFVPFDDLLNWTASADIGLSLQAPDYSPNVAGMLPNKVFEYLMAGLPVLTSLPQVAALLKHYDAGCVVTSREPETIASAITQMLDDREALQRMQRNALLACEQDLRWDIEQRKLLSLYERILRVNLERRVVTAFAGGQRNSEM